MCARVHFVLEIVCDVCCCCGLCRMACYSPRVEMYGGRNEIARVFVLK